MSRLKKILLILLIIATVIGGGAYWLLKNLSETQAELNAVVEPMIRDIASSNWDTSVINKYASDGLKEWFITNNIENLDGLSVLGDVKSYNGVQQFSASSNSASLAALVEYEHGNAVVRMVLLKHDDAWLIDNFNVDSPALIVKAK